MDSAVRRRGTGKQFPRRVGGSEVRMDHLNVRLEGKDTEHQDAQHYILSDI